MGRVVSAVTPVTRASRAIPWRLLIAATAVVALAAAVISIRDTLLVVFLGVFGALVFEVPLRAFMRWTKLGRGLSATIVVLGTAVGVTVLALILLVPLVSSLRDFVKALPELVQELRELGLRFETGDELKPVEGPLSGQTYVITGTLESFTRDEAATALEALGAKVSNSVSKKTAGLIVGEEAGSKLKKAQDAGVPILDEAALQKLLSG